MANFAFINSQNIVIGVNSINNSDITINNSENEVIYSKISCKICLDECETLETG